MNAHSILKQKILAKSKSTSHLVFSRITSKKKCREELETIEKELLPQSHLVFTEQSSFTHLLSLKTNEEIEIKVILSTRRNVMNALLHLIFLTLSL